MNFHGIPGPKSIEQYFDGAISGEPHYLPDDRTRARWLVADSFREQAKFEERSMAARLRGEAGRIEAGYRTTKKILGKIGNRRLDDIFTIFERKFKEKMKAHLTTQTT